MGGRKRSEMNVRVISRRDEEEFLTRMTKVRKTVLKNEVIVSGMTLLASLRLPSSFIESKSAAY
jgi:uncharacterized membrane protein